MKSILYSSSGEKKSEINLPKVFDTPIREDIIFKYLESEKFLIRQPYSAYSEAGKRHSASGTISHKRHEWKGHYGKGISRTPRKTMHRRGTQFYWVAAEVSQARGGRMAHPPQGLYAFRKINKKEKSFAIDSALASTMNVTYIKKRYSSLTANANSAVIESLPSKSKEFISSLKKIFSSAFPLVMKKKSVRAGKGKSRGRKYKSNAGLLLVIGEKEKVSFKGIELVNVKNLSINSLYPLGRLTLYTKQAIDEIAGEKK